ncbi:hypothetical protein EK904_010431 [Melospiza melodia maxima]|nr:hypothetical protein EK904_010431 [Melospiza melodia maxima]
MRRQSVWEDNIKARACYRPFLESCHLRSGLDTPVAKPPHFYRMGFIWSGDLCSSSGRNHQRKDSWLQEQIRSYKSSDAKPAPLETNSRLSERVPTAGEELGVAQPAS